MAIDIKAAVPTRAALDSLAKDLGERAAHEHLRSNPQNLSPDSPALHFGRAEAFGLAAALLNSLLASATTPPDPEDNFEDSSNELDGGNFDDMPF